MDKVIVGLILLSIAVCSDVGAAHADVKDLGNVCISFSIDNAGVPPLTRIYGILAYGSAEQHILLTAIGLPEHGFAVVTGDKIIVTLNNTSVSDDSSVVLFSTTQISFSASTLVGKYTTIHTSPLPGSQSSRFIGTATVVPCQ